MLGIGILEIPQPEMMITTSVLRVQMTEEILPWGYWILNLSYIVQHYSECVVVWIDYEPGVWFYNQFCFKIYECSYDKNLLVKKHDEVA